VGFNGDDAIAHGTLRIKPNKTKSSLAESEDFVRDVRN
jgi:hypothetical protein